MPARRCASAVAAAALLAGPAALLAASPAQATGTTGGEGRASAVVLRTGLDVALLNKTVHVPLKATLNEVQAPASAEETALTVTLDGVDRGRPFQVLRADVATAEATADRQRAEGHSNLARARVHVPGLPLLSLIEVEKVTSKAVCEAGGQPVAESNVLGAVTVLGKRTTLTTGGTTRVAVPGIGEVRLDLSKTETTSSTAAATALRLKVSLNPLKLNVAEVEGEIMLAEATCASPKAPAAAPAEVPAEAPAKQEPVGLEAQSGGTEPAEESLAKTGGSSTTPYVAAGAIALVAAGAASLILARGRSRS